MRRLTLATVIAGWVIIIHLVLATTLEVPDWAWHGRDGLWEQRAFLEATAVLMLGLWWPVPAGMLAGAALAQAISSLIYGSVPNYFVWDFWGPSEYGFNFPDVVLMAGVLLAIGTAISHVLKRGASRA